MTRTTRFKLLYLAELVALGAVAGVVIFLAPEEKRTVAMVLLALLLFIPGRIQGVILREHFRGRRLADLGRFEESVRESEAFLARVAREPWRKKAVWLAGVAYSPDIEAMTLNNLGFAALHLGQLEKAEQSFQRALALDPQYPLPHVNLAVLWSVKGDEAASQRHFAEAARLGYRATTFDAVVRRAQAVVATVEGRGRSRGSTR
jgi:tetratricopeptide (TPR) repeat protein